MSVLAGALYDMFRDSACPWCSAPINWVHTEDVGSQVIVTLHVHGNVIGYNLRADAHIDEVTRRVRHDLVGATRDLRHYTHEQHVIRDPATVQPHIQDWPYLGPIDVYRSSSGYDPYAEMRDDREIATAPPHIQDWYQTPHQTFLRDPHVAIRGPLIDLDRSSSGLDPYVVKPTGETITDAQIHDLAEMRDDRAAAADLARLMSKVQNAARLLAQDFAQLKPLVHDELLCIEDRPTPEAAVALLVTLIETVSRAWASSPSLLETDIAPAPADYPPPLDDAADRFAQMELT